MLAILSLFAATPALAAPGLDAEVLLVAADHSGRVPDELQTLLPGLRQQGFDGAHIVERHPVHLDPGVVQRVELGARDVALELLSVRGGEARVRVSPGRAPPSVTAVRTDAAKFFVTVPARGA
ncbi:MAG: hypothetical protein R3F59_29410 [Myxococcota bacterium]